MLYRYNDASERIYKAPLKTLSTETVEGTARALECVYDVERSDSLALRVFCVGDRVADDLEEGESELGRRVAISGQKEDAHSRGRS